MRFSSRYSEFIEKQGKQHGAVIAGRVEAVELTFMFYESCHEECLSYDERFLFLISWLKKNKTRG